jgi:hypothetical protein
VAPPGGGRAERMTDTSPPAPGASDRRSATNQRLLEDAERRTRHTEARGQAERQERQELQRRWEEAPRFDVSKVPPGGRTRQNGPLDGEAPVRQVVPGDTEYLAAIMRGADFLSGQPHVYAHQVNRYVEQILRGEPFPRDTGPIRVTKDRVVHDGQHQYVAAYIAHRLTGRPLLDGPNAIIPPDAIDLDFQPPPRAQLDPTSLLWRLQVRPPDETSR